MLRDGMGREGGGRSGDLKTKTGADISSPTSTHTHAVSWPHTAARWRWGRERANRTGGILQNPAPPCWHLQSWEAQGCPQLEESTAAIQSRE